jgi:hypothetical protein
MGRRRRLGPAPFQLLASILREAGRRWFSVDNLELEQSLLRRPVGRQHTPAALGTEVIHRILCKRPSNRGVLDLGK